MSKRSLIALVVGLLVLAPLAIVGIAVWTGGGDDSRRAGAIGSSTRTDNYERSYGLRLYADGPGTPQPLGPLLSLTGCAAKANVSEEEDGLDAVGGKHIVGAVAYEPCRLTVRLAGMQPAFYQLLDDILTQQVGRRGFWIAKLDRVGVPKPTGIHIQNALVELAFSELDADALDEEVHLELMLRPQSVAEVSNCCASLPAGGATSVSFTQRLFRNMFEVEIPTVDGAEDTVMVSGFKATQQASGTSVDLELSDLELTVMRHPDGEFHEWFDDFVTNGFGNEKTMTVTMKKGSGQQPGITLSFTGVGIRGREALGLAGSGTAGIVLRDRFTLYVEQATLTSTVAAAPLAAPPPPPPPATTASPPPPPPATTAPPPPPATTAPPPPPPATTAPPPPPPATTPPAAPTAVKFEVLGEGQVRLTWAEVKGADHYVVLTSSKAGGPYEPVAESRAPEHTLERLESGTVIHVVVRAASGEAQSKDSEAIAIEVK